MDSTLLVPSLVHTHVSNGYAKEPPQVDQAPQTTEYFSDGCASYDELVYGAASYQAVQDKIETYSVQGGNADLRHYLARLARKTRCFSGCIDALRRAIKLFVRAYNRRQL